MLLLLALCVGIYLGLHFNILVLAPFCTLGAGAYFATAFSAGQTISGCAGELIGPFTAIQMGFFLGLLSRDPVASILARLHSRSSRRV